MECRRKRPLNSIANNVISFYLLLNQTYVKFCKVCNITGLVPGIRLETSKS